MKIFAKTQGGVTVFIAESTFAEKSVVKQAGFRWHDPKKGPCWSKVCAGCLADVGKTWWTDSRVNAARLIEWADPEARALLQPIVTTVESSRAQTSDLEISAPSGLAYRPFQKAGIGFMLNAFRSYKGVLQGDDMGLGKTIQACGLINADPTIRRVLVLCPNSLRLNWAREAAKWLVRPMRIVQVDKKTAVSLTEPGDLLAIVNYDKLVGSGVALLIKDVLMNPEQEWDLLIADECQALKNPKARRSQVTLDAKAGLLTRAKRFLAMTGTPIPNRPVEIHPVLQACDPAQFPFFPFVRRHCAAHQFTPFHGAKPVWDFSGSSNLEELQAKLRSSIMIRRLKVDVLPELPPKERQIVLLPAEGKVNLAQVERDFATAVSALDRGAVEEFTQFSTQRHEQALAKAPRIVEFVQDVLESNGGKKVIVFAHHKDVIQLIGDGLLSDGKIACLTGDTSVQDRQAAVDAFQTDPEVRVFVGSLLAAGVGLTLTASSHVIFAEEDWVPANVSQAEDRACRIGQLDSVLVQHVVVDGTLDAMMCQAIVGKQEIADRALDRQENFGAAMAEALAAAREDSKGRPRVAYPAATPAEREWAGQVVRYLAGRCDGAATEDGAGFSKLDTSIGKQIAERSLERSLTDGEVAVVKKFAVRYRSQLATREVGNG